MSDPNRIEGTDPVVSRTADMLAYDLALIDACESLGIPHRLLDAPGPAERSAVERRLMSAGLIEWIPLPAEDEAAAGP